MRVVAAVDADFGSTPARALVVVRGYTRGDDQEDNRLEGRRRGTKSPVRPHGRKMTRVSGQVKTRAERHGLTAAADADPGACSPASGPVSSSPAQRLRRTGSVPAFLSGRPNARTRPRRSWRRGVTGRPGDPGQTQGARDRHNEPVASPVQVRHHAVLPSPGISRLPTPSPAFLSVTLSAGAVRRVEAQGRCHGHRRDRSVPRGRDNR